MAKRLELIGAVLLALATLMLGEHYAIEQHFAMGDFRAFYCAGDAVVHRLNPYDAAVIHACEAAPENPAFFTAKPHELLPAPVPGYVAAAFAPFAFLPFPIAALGFATLSITALALACRYFALAGIPSSVLIVALSILVCDVSLPVGELPPFALLGLAFAVYGVRVENTFLVVCGAALTMTEPQVGITILAILATTRKFALPAMLTALSLAVISLAAIGVNANIEYAFTVLPEHVLSELPSIHQYTISWFLFMLGAPDRLAILAARIAYLFAVIAAVLLARTAFAKRNLDLSLLAAPAIAMSFGPFLHLDHVILAIPAATVLAMRSKHRVLGTVMICGLAIPLVRLFVIPNMIAIGLIVAGAIAYWRFKCIPAALIAAPAALVYIVLCAMAIIGTGLHLNPSPPVAVLHVTQATWATYVRHNWAATAWPLYFIKGPVCLALIAAAAWYTRRMFERPNGSKDPYIPPKSWMLTRP